MSRVIYTPREERLPRRRFHMRRFFLVLAAFSLLGVIIAGMVYVLRFPRWQIREISFSGLEVLSQEEIASKIKHELQGEFAALIPRSSFFLAETASLAESLQKEFPRIEQISIKKDFPDKLKISAKERKLFGIFCGQSSCAYIDASGFAYESAPNFSGSLITKIKSDAPDPAVGQNAVEPALMERLIFLGEEIKRSLGIMSVVHELSSQAPREIRVETDEGFKIFFNRDDDFQNVFRVLKTVLDEEIKEKRARLEYIDVRFGNKAFYRLK
ncbi:MAG: FtsQ-type POTRA domain-containing protein [Candidatus Sungbacteria bacterium]|nr:FtsQ-type POTRA domain-containing protein [Candidatus Sungbacteria bacterium]